MSTNTTSNSAGAARRFGRRRMKVGAAASSRCRIRISIACFSSSGRIKSRPAQIPISRSVSMAGQHTENLLRRYKGKLVTVSSISGNVYKGEVGEITNDYVLLTDSQMDNARQTFVLLQAIESIAV